MTTTISLVNATFAPPTGPADPAARRFAAASPDGAGSIGEDQYWPQKVDLPDGAFLSALNPLHHLPVVGTLYRVATRTAVEPPLLVAGSMLTGLALGGPVGGLGTALICLAEELVRMGPDRSGPAVPAGFVVTGSEAGAQPVAPDAATGGRWAEPCHAGQRVGGHSDAGDGDDMTRAVLRADGLMTMERLVARAVIGHGGVRADKREGDGATPVGVLPLRRVLYRADRVRPAPRAAVPVGLLGPEDGWCDDPGHADYNRMIALPHEGRYEALWRADGVYDVIGVLGWNDSPVERGRGSAIFVHVARPDGAPTEGCVALALGDLLAFLAAGLSEIEVLARG